MKGDFSRLTFSEANHYRRVLSQQGRVEVDADANEQAAIADHIGATTSYDVIGQSGYPLGDLPGTTTPAGGFALGFSPASGTATDLSISAGRMYVDGILVENDAAAATLLSQPDLPGATLADLGYTGPGVYVVYLDVWERLVTALDNAAIRETALGGPDTAARSKTVWQVKLGYVEAIPAAGGAVPTCASVPSQPSTPAQGTLAAGSAAPGSTVPCILPAATGYQLLENQLYRVEIHQSGSGAAATFKWSRENGSVAVGVAGSTQNAAGTILGPTFAVNGFQSDPTLSFQTNDFVELIDDHTELVDGHGELLQVQTAGNGQVVTTAAAATGVNHALHPKLRRWDQTTGTGAGIPVTPGTWVALEGGVQVMFSSGYYKVGDYWLIPARTATSVQQGFVEWPVDGSGNAQALPAAGIRHHYAKLGLVAASGSTFTPLGTNTTPTDCRLPFPPLTDLMPSQPKSPCTVVVAPGPAWQEPILELFQGATSPLDAEICFPAGDFPVTTPLVIANAGNLRINGAGWGTRLVAAAGGPATLLSFSNCLSVSVRDLHAQTPTVATKGGIAGVLSFADCAEVVVEGCSVTCGSTVGKRGAACVAITTGIARSSAGKTAPDASTIGPGSARVRGCRLYVGEMQVGVELVNQARATVEDNEITVDPAVPVTTTPIRLADPFYRSVARKYLISGAVVAATTPGVTTGAQAVRAAPVTAAPVTAAPAAAAPAPPPAATPAPATSVSPTLSTTPPIVRATIPTSSITTTPVTPTTPPPTASAPPPAAGATPTTAAPPRLAAALAKTSIAVTLGKQTLNFSANPILQGAWQTYLNTNAPGAFASQKDALTYVKAQANKILLNPTARTGITEFNSIINIFNEHVPLAARGIVAGGATVGDLRILNNTISGVLMGISAGASHRASPAEAKAKQRTPNHMDTVRIVGNTITCGANDLARSLPRYGIFAGSVNCLEIEGNRLSQSAAGIASPPFTDAIRVCGYLGAKTIVRRNDTAGFSLGVRVVPLTGNGPGTQAQPLQDTNYLTPVRSGNQWLVADNAIQSAAASPTALPDGPFSRHQPAPTCYVEAAACLRVNNAYS